MRFLSSVALLLCMASLAAAQDSDSPNLRHGTGFVVGGKAGFGIGAPFNELGGTPVGELELGFVLPLPEPVDRRLQIFAAGSYVQPGTSGETDADPRLPGDGVLHYELRQRMAVVTFGGLYRFSLDALAPYAAIGGRLYMMETETSGDVDGEPIGTNRETRSTFGGYLAGGVDYLLGPGALLAELQLSYAPVDGFVLRDTNVAGLSLAIGYRVFFGSAPARSSDDASTHDDGFVEPDLAPAGPADAAAPAQSTATEPGAQEPAAQPTTAPAAAAAPVAAATPPDSGPAPGLGQIRGNVRSFRGAPLDATVRITPGNHKVKTEADGVFSVDVEPGRYNLRIRSYGYRSQSRAVVVTPDGVTVMNVELRKK
jgi:hypothetical protein